jgi:hypothetical protein
MAYDENLADRVRAALPGDADAYAALVPLLRLASVGAKLIGAKIDIS